MGRHPDIIVTFIKLEVYFERMSGVRDNVSVAQKATARHFHWRDMGRSIVLGIFDCYLLS